MSEDSNIPQNENYQRHRKHERQGIFFPLLLVAVGVYLLYHNIGNGQGSGIDHLLQLWPLLLIIAGLDGIVTGDGFVGSVIIIGIGAFFLLNNLGYVNTGDIWSILRFWPVLLIAWGLDLIIGRHSIISAILGILLGTGLLAGMAWLALNPVGGINGQSPVNKTIQQNLKGVTSAHIVVSSTTGIVNVTGATESPYLVQGSLDVKNSEAYYESYTQEKKRGNYRIVDDEDKFTNILGYYPYRVWAFQFNPGIPLDADFELTVGEMKLDLRKLNIDRLSSEQAVGRTVITLPEGSYRGSISVPVGEIVLKIPEDVNARIYVDTALTSVEYPYNYEKNDEIITSGMAGKNTAEADVEIDVNLPLGRLLIETY